VTSARRRLSSSRAGGDQEFSHENSMRAMMTMMLLMLAELPECVAFRAFESNSQSSQIEQYSLLDPEPCGNMEKVHAIERELYGEIVQIKKEQLVQVTRCTATQTIKTVSCGWQSRSAPSDTRRFTTQSPSSRQIAGRRPRRGASSSMGRSTRSR
jgi:hypothetical protein